MSINNYISVMTWDLYLGADLKPLTTIKPELFHQEVTNLFRQVLATNFKDRAKAIADKILSYEPDIICLQSVALWKLLFPNLKTVEFDYLKILLDSLKYLGLNYEVAVINNNFTGELPSSLGNTISLLDRDVILVNKDSEIYVIDSNKDNFKNNLDIQLGEESFVVLKGWEYIDICINYTKCRIINTNLELYSNDINIAQGKELLEGPANVNMPIILAGNFNSDANTNEKTYEALIENGFEDTWIIGGIKEGFTAYQDSDLLSAYSNLDKRVDLILVKSTNNFTVVKDFIVGNKQSSRSKLNLWPSTHAGVISKLNIKKLRFKDK